MLLHPLLSLPARAEGALTLPSHRKPISTLELTAATVGERPACEIIYTSTEPFPQRRKSSPMKPSSTPLLSFSTVLPVEEPPHPTAAENEIGLCYT